jgi:hypothetical protein
VIERWHGLYLQIVRLARKPLVAGAGISASHDDGLTLVVSGAEPVGYDL